MKQKVMILGLLLVGMISQLMTVEAKGPGSIDIEKNVVQMSIGETASITVSYDDIDGGASDLACVSANNAIVGCLLQDKGNKKMQLLVNSVGQGATTVAVYRISNPAVVDYITIQSGMVKSDSDIITMVNGNSLTTVFKDRMVHYPYVMVGEQNDQLQVTGLKIERESGRDCLKVSGNLLTKDTKTPGINIFYADFYGAAGELLIRQPVFSRDPYTGYAMNIKWYIPEGCMSVSLE